MLLSDSAIVMQRTFWGPK